jgi:hypothetical protein
MADQTRVLIAALLYPGIAAGGHPRELCIVEALTVADELLAAASAPPAEKKAVAATVHTAPVYGPQPSHAIGSNAPPIGQQAPFATPPTAHNAGRQDQTFPTQPAPAQPGNGRT